MTGAVTPPPVKLGFPDGSHPTPGEMTPGTRQDGSQHPVRRLLYLLLAVTENTAIDGYGNWDAYLLWLDDTAFHWF